MYSETASPSNYLISCKVPAGKEKHCVPPEVGFTTQFSWVADAPEQFTVETMKLESSPWPEMVWPMAVVLQRLCLRIFLELRMLLKASMSSVWLVSFWPPSMTLRRELPHCSMAANILSLIPGFVVIWSLRSEVSSTIEVTSFCASMQALRREVWLVERVFRVVRARLVTVLANAPVFYALISLVRKQAD